MGVQARLVRAQRKMIPGTFGGRSKVATPVVLKPKRVVPSSVAGLVAVLNSDIFDSVFSAGGPVLQEVGNWSVYGDLAGAVPGGGAGIIATLDPGAFDVTLTLTGYSVFGTTLSFGVPSDLHAITGSASFTVTVPAGPAQVLGFYCAGPAPPEAAWNLSAGSTIGVL